MDAAIKARIRRASKKARSRLKKIDAQSLKRLKQLYRRARKDIEARINAAESLDGRVHLEQMQRLLNDINTRLGELTQSRDALLGSTLRQSVDTGVSPFAVASNDVTALAEAALLQSVNFIAADGLQLSDRLWRVDQGARELISREVQNAIVQGDSASRAAREFLTKNLDIPADLQRKIGRSQAQKIAAIAGRELGRSGNTLANIRRVFRTEINRAHGEAYIAAAFESEDVIGTRFLLSPNHPETDICDMHARVNRYGLGPGVYPRDRNPWPAHPNTLSFVEAVFDDEVTEEDRKGKQTRLEWLKNQSPARQQLVLNSRKKAAALHAGLLAENQINTPWYKLKTRYEKNGVAVDQLKTRDNFNITHSEISKPGLPKGVKISSKLDPVNNAQLVAEATDLIDQVHGDGKMPMAIVRENNENPGALGYFKISRKQKIEIGVKAESSWPLLTLLHEAGHFLNHKGLPGSGPTSDNHPAMQAWRKAVANSPEVKNLVLNFDETTNSEFKKYLHYLLNPDELFARSYAQYIAVKTQHPVAINQLNRRRSTTHFQQWSDDSFEPIMQAIDELFVQQGWIHD